MLHCHDKQDWEVEAQNLSKSFFVPEHGHGVKGALKSFFGRAKKEVKALDNLSFSMRKGEIIGLIGPNGAGKSTLVKILSGILLPDSGSVSVLGMEPSHERMRLAASIGVVFGQRTQLWWDLPLAESFILLAKIYGIDKGTAEKRTMKLVERLDFAAQMSTPVRQLSLGQRMRADFAAALLHRPRLLFLDEPTIGLDAYAKLAVRSFVKEINRDEGVGLVLTTHDMDDVEALCERVLVISNGHLSHDGSIEDLRAKASASRIIRLEFEAHVHQPWPALPQGATWMQDEDGMPFVKYAPGKVSTPNLISIIASSMPVKDIIVQQTPIEEIVAQIYSNAQ